MQNKKLWRNCFLFNMGVVLLLLSGCANQGGMQLSGNTSEDERANDFPMYHGQAAFSSTYNESRYMSALPQEINLGKEKVILIDPRAHAWGAYNADGMLVKGGIATAGADYCPDEGHACRTNVGTFRVYSLGEGDCRSRTYPIGKGGSLMPYCMFFNKGQSLHGSPDQMMVDANISHGCVHMRIPDAEWLRYDFARVGTKVVVLPY